MNCRLLVALAVSFLLIITTATADQIFFDDFSDGSVTNDVPLDRDGNPVVWTPLASSDGTGDATSGDYVITGNVFAFTSHNELTDTSIRAQVRLMDVEDSGSISVLARANPEALTAYQAGIRTSGLFPESGAAFIARFDAGGTSRTLSFAAPNVDVFSGEVFMQFDVIGNDPAMLRLFVWDGDVNQKPADPLLNILDSDTLSSGVTGVGALSDAGTGVFRFVHVADSSIPEPSTAALAIAALAAVACLRRRTLGT